MIEANNDINNFDSDDGKNYVHSLLHDESVSDLCITFTKKDGTERVMHATLLESKIPTEKQPKEGSVVKHSSAAQRVFDTQIGEWRSFRWDSVKAVSFSQ